MSSAPDLPSEFDVVTVVVLRRPADAPELSEDELAELQARHRAYRADLVSRGRIVANGPFRSQSDESYRGMSVFACGTDEATRLSAADPAVLAGRLTFAVMEWWVRADALAFPRSPRPVGERHTMADD